LQFMRGYALVFHPGTVYKTILAPFTKPLLAPKRFSIHQFIISETKYRRIILSRINNIYNIKLLQDWPQTKKTYEDLKTS